MLSNQEHHLDDELRAIELQLYDLAPCSLSSDSLLRMEQAMGEWSQHQERLDSGGGASQLACSDLNELEIHLNDLAPSAVPDDILARMSRAMDSWHEYVPVDEKVVLFNAAKEKSSSYGFGGNMWTAAAAVAVLGAVTALVLPRFDSAPGNFVVEKNPTPPSMKNVAAKPFGIKGATLTSNSLSHQVTNTSDNGVVFSNDNTPHRCIRVDYVDRIRGKDAHGRQVEINTPGVDFLLIPVETN